MTRILPALLALTPLAGPAAAAPTVAEMKNHRRVLIVASPSAGDARLAQQRAVAGWRSGARDRDLSVVEVIGAQVDGAADPAPLLRRRWRLPPDEFQVVLVGKDGHEALRAGHPLAAAQMQRTIDSMPMRRAGHR